MSVEAMWAKALISAAESMERLQDIGRRIRFEVDAGYEWTRDTGDIEDVRAAWVAAWKELDSRSR